MKRHAAFTLLETLLALTVMASMSVLIAQAFRVAHDAADGGAHLERAVQVDRVLRLMQDQWADRRVVKLEGDEPNAQSPSKPGVTCSEDAVRFITATAILQPEAPLVEASWMVERAEAEPGAAPSWNLVYQERPITSFRADREARSKVSRLAVLQGCTSLRLEQFVPVKLDGRSASDRVIEHLAWITPEKSPEVSGEMQSLPIAVRFVGAYQGEDIACVFAVQALR
ncbi:MAG: hypothetical protein KDA20_02385 [Phycisphaerales bacterium]|nr:hypothetical protein [Phycisphaerales bacterium]